jgi:hypothetical protein
MNLLNFIFKSKAEREAEAARRRREARLAAIEREHANQRRENKTEASEWVESVLARHSEFESTRQRLKP